MLFDGNAIRFFERIKYTRSMRKLRNVIDDQRNKTSQKLDRCKVNFDIHTKYKTKMSKIDKFTSTAIDCQINDLEYSLHEQDYVNIGSFSKLLENDDTRATCELLKVRSHAIFQFDKQNEIL